MTIIRGSEHFHDTGCALTMGNFDGVHRGHQYILGVLKKCARKSVVYTFDPHPVKVLSPNRPLPLIQTIEQRAATLLQFVDIVVIEPFSLAFAKQRASQFFDEVLCKRLQPKEIVIGYDFTFGAHREGNTDLLRELGKKAGIPVTIIPAQFQNETLVSSSAIRQLIQAGRLENANALMGRPLVLSGTVVSGRGQGRKIGFATANLATPNECIPAAGIYASRLQFDHGSEPSVTYIGTNPTLGTTKLAIETHVLVPVPELLGKQVQVEILNRIRGEMKFDSVESLKTQIADDCQAAMSIHAAR